MRSLSTSSSLLLRKIINNIIIVTVRPACALVITTTIVTFLLTILSSSSLPSFVLASSNSPNGNNLLSYTTTHTCGRNMELVACHMQADASHFFCGHDSSGTYESVLKFTVSPFAEAATSSTTAMAGCALIEATSQFVCFSETDRTKINFYSMASLTEQHQVIISGAFLEGDRSLLYFEDYIYVLDTFSSFGRVYRVKDVSSTAVFDTTLSFSASTAEAPKTACVSGTDSSNRKLIVQVRLSSITSVIVDIDISGSSPAPNFAETSFVTIPESLANGHPFNSDSMACSETHAYITLNNNRVSRLQTIPNLEFLDSLFYGVGNPTFTGLTLLGGGQYLLVSESFGLSGLLLLDVTKFPGHSIIEKVEIPGARTGAGAIVAVPVGTDPRDGGTFKAFAFVGTLTCEIYELELKNLDGPIVIPPNVTYNEDVYDLARRRLVFCQADTAGENIYCGVSFSDQVPVRITADPVTVAVIGAQLPSTNDLTACDLGESQSAYYCIYEQGGGVSFRSFNIPSLSTRHTADISASFQLDRSSIAFAEIGGSQYLFSVDEKGLIYRSNLDATTTVTSDLNTLSGGAVGTAIVNVRYCPTESEDQHVFTAGVHMSRIHVARVNGDLSNAAFPAGAYDTNIQIPDANFNDFNSADTVDCTKSHFYVTSGIYGKIAKFSISPFAFVAVSSDEMTSSPIMQGLTISFDAKFLIAPTTSPTAVFIIDPDTLHVLHHIDASQSFNAQCASASNFRVYCPLTNSELTVFDLIPFSSEDSVTKTKSLQSVTLTRTRSISTTLQSLTSTRSNTASPSVQSLTKTQSLQSLSKTQTLQSLTSTRTISSTASLQSLTLTRTVSLTNSISITPSLQSLTLTRTVTKSKSFSTSQSLQSLTETKTRSISPSLQSLTSTKTVSSTKSSSSSQSLQSLTLSGSVSFSRTRSVSSTIQSLTRTRTLSSSGSRSQSATLQSLTPSKSKSKSTTLRSLSSTKTISKSSSLQSRTSTRSVSSTSLRSASASLQSITSTKTKSASRTLQSLTSTKSVSVSPTQQSLTRTISASKSPSLQSLTSTRSLSKSASIQSLTSTKTVSSTKTTSVSATLQSLTATKSSSKSASLQSLTKTHSLSASRTLQSLTTTQSRSKSASLRSLTSTRSVSVSATLQSLTATRSISSSATLQSLTSTRSSSGSLTLFSLTKTNSRSSSATLFSRSKSLTLVSQTQTHSRSPTVSSTLTSSKSTTTSRSLQSLTVTQTPFSRSRTLSSTKTSSITATFTLPPTPSTTGSLTATRSKTASLQSLSKTKTSSRSLQSLSKTKTKTSLVTPPPATTTAAPAGDNVINNLPPSSNIANALVVSVPSCPSSLNSKCQVRHPQSNECRCPQNTHEQNITLLPSFAFLPSSSATSQLIDQVGNPCVRNEFILGICTASTSERFMSSYTRFGGTTSDNGICEQTNPFTNDCSCRTPSTKASFAIATGTQSSFIKKFVTFCLPPNGDLSVFWTIHPDVATASNRAETSCVSPNGNVTCECTAGASKTSFGASIFPDSSSIDPVPGDLTFCKAKPAEPEEEINLPVTTTGTVVGIVGGFIEGGGANAVVGIQVAALLMTLCDNNPNVSTSGAKSVVVFFEYPGLPPSAGGLAFMLTLTLGVFFLHALVCLLVGLKRFATSQKIEFDPDKIDYFEEEIETPSFFEQIRFASLQLRFPHWSFFVMNIGFSGVVVESTILLQNTEDDIMVVLGAIGLVLSLIYIALTLYYSYWGIRGVADVRIFDVDESGTTKKLVKTQKKLKKTVAQLTEVPITDDAEVFPNAPLKLRGTRSSSSRNNISTSRHRAVRSSSSRKQSSSTRFRSFKAFSSRSNVLSSDVSASSSSSDEEQGHKWLNRRKSIQPSSTPSTSNALRNSSSRRKSNTASSSKKPSSRRSSSQQSKMRESSEVDDSEVVYSEAERDEEEEQSRQISSRVKQDRKSSTVKMPTDDEDEAEESAGDKNDIKKSSSSSSVFSERNKQMKRAVSKRRNPLRPPPRRIRDDEDTSSAEDLDLDESDDDEHKEEEEEENQHEQQQVNENELTDDDKPPHYVKYGKAMKLFHRFCSFSEYILPNGWWIKHRLYNRRYASMYNSFQPRPTAWAPTTIRLFLFSVSVASSLGGCLIPVTYVGSMALLIALMFLVARPCRRPFDNILLALQLILGSTLAFSRSSNPELSVKLFYGVIGVTFIYVVHIMLLEGLETVSMSSLELFEFKSGKVHGHDDDSQDDEKDADESTSSEDDSDEDSDKSESEKMAAAQKKIAKALSSAHSRHEKKKSKRRNV